MKIWIRRHYAPLILFAVLLLRIFVARYVWGDYDFNSIGEDGDRLYHALLTWFWRDNLHKIPGFPAWLPLPIVTEGLLLPWVPDLRLVSPAVNFFFSQLAVVALFVLVRLLFADTLAALAGALLLTASRPFYLFSFEGGMADAQLLFLLLAGSCFLVLFEQTLRFRFLLGTACLFLLGSAVRFEGWLLLPSFLALCLSHLRTLRARIFLPMAISLLLVGLWIGYGFSSGMVSNTFDRYSYVFTAAGSGAKLRANLQEIFRGDVYLIALLAGGVLSWLLSLRESRAARAYGWLILPLCLFFFAGGPFLNVHSGTHYHVFTAVVLLLPFLSHRVAGLLRMIPSRIPAALLLLTLTVPLLRQGISGKDPGLLDTPLPLSKARVHRFLREAYARGILGERERIVLEHQRAAAPMLPPGFLYLTVNPSRILLDRKDASADRICISLDEVIELDAAGRREPLALPATLLGTAFRSRQIAGVISHSPRTFRRLERFMLPVLDTGETFGDEPPCRLYVLAADPDRWRKLSELWGEIAGRLPERM